MTMTELTAPDAAVASPGPWLAVCRLDQLEPLWGEAALVGGDQVALLRLPDGSVRAVGHADPATGAHVMARGIVGSRGGRTTLASPLHKDVF
uniref:nitrite reductase (NAD(P)H) small subunit n=1 Tax=Clavibacter sp. MX14-G9D TaxID=3064656 RepID=UPI0037C17617